MERLRAPMPPHCDNMITQPNKQARPVPTRMP
jgi:hypothetical protein